jgi:hypothetical protein
MSEFPPLIYVDLVRDEPFTRDEYSLMRAGDDVDDIALAYAKYLEHFQPWRLLIKSGDNQEPLFRSTESYFNRADAIHAAELAFGAGSNVYLREAEHGNRVLRMSVRVPQRQDDDRAVAVTVAAELVDTAVYIAALNVGEIFADPTYQRTCDVARARKMAGAWDRRLAGILEVSDRGESHTPRYAVMDGQHRWAAAGYLADPPPLVANVHTGLTVADEAGLFDKLNRQRKQTPRGITGRRAGLPVTTRCSRSSAPSPPLAFTSPR